MTSAPTSPAGPLPNAYGVVVFNHDLTALPTNFTIDNVIEGNVISGNTSGGLLISQLNTNRNKALGNFIGVDATGLAPLPNGGFGVRIDQSAADNTIGGNTSADRNTISANAGDGVQISDGGTTGNLVAGNYIGTDVNGLNAFANLGSGVNVSGGATGNTVGGTNNFTLQTQVVSTGGDLVAPTADAVGPDGDVYVIDANSEQVIKIDPTTGIQTVVSSGQFFTSPTGIAFAPNGTLYVVDNRGCRYDLRRRHSSRSHDGHSDDRFAGPKLCPAPAPDGGRCRRRASSTCPTAGPRPSSPSIRSRGSRPS